jgi:hypothetical protein
MHEFYSFRIHSIVKLTSDEFLARMLTSKKSSLFLTPCSHALRTLYCEKYVWTDAGAVFSIAERVLD